MGIETFSSLNPSNEMAENHLVFDLAVVRNNRIIGKVVGFRLTND